MLSRLRWSAAFGFRTRFISFGLLVILGAGRAGGAEGIPDTPYWFKNLVGPSGWLTPAAASRQMIRPQSLAVDSAGNVYVTDGSYAVRKITPKGEVTILAGSQAKPGNVDGKGSQARFGVRDWWRGPGLSGIAVDTVGNVYVADPGNQAVRKITPNGTVSTLSKAGKSEYFEPIDLVVDSSGNVFVATPYALHKITPAGKRSVLAGDSWSVAPKDGTGSEARFWFLDAITIDAAGTLFVSDAGTIRKITPAGVVTTLVGKFQDGADVAPVDGKKSAARFGRRISGIAVDAGGTLWATEPENNSLRTVSPAGTVKTVSNRVRNFTDGVLAEAYFGGASDVAIGPKGTIYIADTQNDAVRIL